MAIYYHKNNNRLVYIEKNATAEYWDESWSEYTEESLAKIYKNDSYVSRITKKYLPKGSVIVEGGCGRGNHVHALFQNGYKSIGLDFAPKTIELLKKTAPNLDIRLDDVRNTKLHQNSVDGYWSLGVIEHFYNGFDLIADDIARILRKDGYVFLTFPAMNSLRSLKAKMNIYPEYRQEYEENFYQFALDPKVVIEEFKMRGFELISFKRSNGFKGLKDESPRWLKYLLQKIYDSNNIISKALGFFLDKLISNLCGHIAIMVFKKI